MIPVPSLPGVVKEGQLTYESIRTLANLSFGANDVFVGSGPGHSVGLVPDPGPVAGTSRYLCEDGTWVSISALIIGGVALQAATPGVAQVGNANITGTMIATTFIGNLTGNASTSSDGLTSATGTAPLTLGLAAKALTGSVATMSGDLGAGGTSGVVPAQVVGDGAKFLRGDATWQTISTTTLGAVPTSRTISTTAPLTGGGDLSANRTFAVSDMSGDLGAGGTRGTAPAQAPGDAVKFLRGDATWSTPTAAQVSYNQASALGLLATSGATTVQTALDDIDNIMYTSAEPHGLEMTSYKTPVETTISYDAGTRTFSIAPKAPNTDFRVYVKGKRYTFAVAQTVSHAATEGLWFFYFDGSGVLTASQTPWTLRTYCPVALIYWDNSNLTNITFAEERHGLTMDSTTHEYLHKTIGTRYETGLAIGDYTLASAGNITASFTDGIVHDEDITVSITHAAVPGTNQFEQVLRTANKALIPIYYRFGVNGDWRKKAASASGYLVDGPGGNARHYYNQLTGGAWQETEVGATDYSAVWIFATDNISEPVIAILGQREDTSLANARSNNTYESLAFGTLPFAEFKILYRLIFKSAAGVAAWPGKVSLEDVQDLRSVSNVPAGTYVATAHSALTGLDYASANHTGFVELQAGTPGTAQTGHINVTGTVIGDTGLFGTNLMAGNYALAYPADTPVTYIASSTLNALVDITSLNANADGAQFVFRSMGTNVGSGTKTGDRLGFIGFRGHDGSNFLTASNAAIIAGAAEATTVGAAGSYIAFEGTPTGSTTRAEWARLQNARLGIGVSPSASLDVFNKFHVDSTGNIVKTNNVTTNWPAANAAGVLTNDGAGNFSWSAAGSLTGAGASGQVTFWTGASTLDGDDGLWWDDTTKNLAIGNVAFAPNRLYVGKNNATTGLDDIAAFVDMYKSAPDAAVKSTALKVSIANSSASGDAGIFEGVVSYYDGAGDSAVTSATQFYAYGSLGNTDLAERTGLLVEDIFSFGGDGTLTTQYGVKVGGLTQASTNWSLYTTDAANYFGGDTQSAGKIGIGLYPTVLFHVAGSGATSQQAFETFSTTVGDYSGLEFRRSHHASIGNYTTTVDTDQLGGLVFKGVNAAGSPALALGAAINAVQDGNATATQVPTYLRFRTSDGTTFAEQMRISPAGYVGIGTSPSFVLHVQKSVGTTGANSTQVYSLLNATAADASYSRIAITGDAWGNHTSGTIGTITGVNGNANGAGNGGTSTVANSFAASAAVGTGHTIGARYGLYVSDTTGAGTLTNQYGLYVASMTKGASSNWGVYVAGTTNNSYFGGPVSIGTATTSRSLGIYKSAVSTEIIGSALNPAIYIRNNSGAALNEKAEVQLATTNGGGMSVITSIYENFIGAGSYSTALLFSTQASGDSAVTCQATEKMRLTSAGWLGIGGTPVQMLDIRSTAPSFQMTDTTASAKSLRVVTDANVASFYEAAGSAGDILSLDLANKRVGVVTAAPGASFDVATKFQIDANGDIVKLKNVTTSFPSANSVGVLTNDGSGNMTWAGTGAGVSTMRVLKETVFAGIATASYSNGSTYTIDGCDYLCTLAGNGTASIVATGLKLTRNTTSGANQTTMLVKAGNTGDLKSILGESRFMRGNWGLWTRIASWDFTNHATGWHGGWGIISNTSGTTTRWGFRNTSRARGLNNTPSSTTGGICWDHWLGGSDINPSSYPGVTTADVMLTYVRGPNEADVYYGTYSAGWPAMEDMTFMGRVAVTSTWLATATSTFEVEQLDHGFGFGGSGNTNAGGCEIIFDRWRITSWD